jgi:hypothetical protein
MILRFPSGATHISLKGSWAKVDFANNISDVKLSNVINLPIDAVSTNVILTPSACRLLVQERIYLFYKLSSSKW